MNECSMYTFHPTATTAIGRTRAYESHLKPCGDRFLYRVSFWLDTKIYIAVKYFMIIELSFDG